MLRKMRYISFPVLMVSFAACVSGGKFVASDEPLKVLVTYESKGPAPPNVKWYLIRTESGLAILEKDLSGGSNTVVEQAWKDRTGYHFVFWAEFLDAQSAAFEFIVPEDISKPATRYTYPAGSYSIVKGNGVSRPVPHNKAVTPVTRLIPGSTN